MALACLFGIRKVEKLDLMVSPLRLNCISRRKRLYGRILFGTEESETPGF